jgi:UDP-N-acetyl-D-galactosamine dehydrogenase
VIENLLGPRNDALLPQSVLAEFERTGRGGGHGSPRPAPPQVIRSGRWHHAGMGRHIAVETVKQMVARGSAVSGANVNVLGLTFREDCPDLRNSRVVDLIDELRSFGVRVFVHDPVADPAAARHAFRLSLTPWCGLPAAAATIVAVAHRAFVERPLADFVAKTAAGGCFIDVRSRFDAERLRARGLAVWRP